MLEGLAKKIYIVFLLLAIGQAAQFYFEFEERRKELTQQIPAIRNELDEKKSQVAKTEEFFSDIEEAKRRIELVAAETEKIQRRLPTEIKDAENLELVKGISQKINIQNVYLTPEEDENKGFYFVRKYRFRGTGTFLQFLVLFEKISEVERILNIRSVNIVKSEEEDRSQFQLVNVEAIIEAYRYNLEHKEKRGIDEIEQVDEVPAKEEEKKG